LLEKNIKEESRAWYVIRTKPHKEKIAQVNYQQQGYHVYLPMMKKEVRHARKIKKILKPFFPGYIFLHLSPSQENWYAISSTRGVLAPVQFGEQFIPVPDMIIEQIKANEISPGILSPEKIFSDHLEVGNEVDVTLPGGGKTKGVVFSFDGKKNVVVLMELLQRKVKASLPVESLEFENKFTCE
jgi:transcriptional antiterminator RfaH